VNHHSPPVAWRRMTHIAALAAALVFPVAARAQGTSSSRLGTIHFTVTDDAAAQRAFERGVLLLHSFEYGASAEAFRKAQELQPGLVLAYWGEAMTYNHPIWNQRDRGAAMAALARLAPTPEARLAKTTHPRDRGLLEAIEILYREGPKPERDTAYSEAMERLVAEFPDDPEVRLFYALSLEGLSQGVRVVPTYMRAAAIAEEVFRANPDHPGAAHYLIHAFDDPTHAPLGLTAARAYSRIAPGAAHAQHMTTHIFLALGMWDQVVSQNTIAAEQTWWGPGHYTSWLSYGLAQQGRFAAADSLLVRARAEHERRNSGRTRSALTIMRAHHVILTERWDHPILGWPIDTAGLSPTARATDAFARGLAALQRGDRAAAAATALLLDRIEAGDAGAPPVLTAELNALLLLDEGRTDSAMALLHHASAIEDGLPIEFGPPDIVKPSHELLGEVLLAAQRPVEAHAEFERALALAPGRALSLRGLARSAHAAGDEEAARKAYRTLREVWHAADPGIRGLTEARSVAAR